MELYVDLDGVLVDLERGCVERLGFGWVGWHPNMVGKELDRRKQLEDLILEKDFFANLDPMPDFEVMVMQLKTFSNVHILTAQAHEHSENVRLGKLEWCAKFLPWIPEDYVHVVERKEKQLFARANQESWYDTNILIDDYDQNIIEWSDAGGLGIFHASAIATSGILDFFRDYVVGR